MEAAGETVRATLAVVTLAGCRPGGAVLGAPVAARSRERRRDEAVIEPVGSAVPEPVGVRLGTYA